jgi:hypothetical protein
MSRWKSGTEVRVLIRSGTGEVRRIPATTGQNAAALLILCRKSRGILLIRHLDDGLLFRGREAE